jgi:DNA-binding transcriptional MerR regulator
MYIGKAAKLTGATPKAIRYYEAIGLMAPPKRLGKYRYYSERDINVIRLIKSAQKYGFKLSELENIVNKKRSDDQFPDSEIVEAIGKKRRQIKSEINKLNAMDRGLEKLRDQIINKKCFC